MLERIIMKTLVTKKEISNKKMSNEKNQAPKKLESINDGYNTTHENDPIGTWDEKTGPCYFIPKFAKVFDGNIEKAKPAVLILGTLTQKTMLYKGKEDDDNRTIFEGKEGDFISVWGKPGMGAIRNMAGIPIKLWQEGEKDTKKPNPMKLYKVATKGNVEGKQLRIKEDMRDKSFGVTCFLEDRSNPKTKMRVNSDTNGDIEFDPIQ
jgi:hypothetical protein